MTRTTLAALGLALLALPALAHDPFVGIERTDPRSGAKIPCCGGGPTGDCFDTQTRWNDEGALEVFIPEDKVTAPHPALWVPVPSYTVLPVELNPNAGPVVCWTPGRGVICFMHGRGG